MIILKVLSPEWKMIEGIPRNLPISVLTYDPNNTNIFYAGTGELILEVML
jgi:hypothetical protein